MQKILYLFVGYVALALIFVAPVIHTDPPSDPMRKRHYWSRCYSVRRWREHDLSFKPKDIK